jgi:hypothetical protein
MEKNIIDSFIHEEVFIFAGAFTAGVIVAGQVLHICSRFIPYAPTC